MSPTATEQQNTGQREPTLKLVEGRTAFSYITPAADTAEVTVHIRPEAAEHWPAIFASQPFQSWAQQYEKHVSYSLKSITIQSVKMSDNAIVSVVIEPTFTPSSVQCPTIVLGCQEVGVLTILRCVNSAGSGANFAGRPRDFVLFTARDRPALAHSSNLEIMRGTFGEEGVLEGKEASEFHSLIDVHINMSDLVCLTKDKAEKGVVPSASCCPTALPLYLFRLNITETELDRLQLASSAETESPQTSLVALSLGEAWKMTSDASSMAALFLFHEFRYHGLMPKYRPPRDAKQPDIVYEKRKPKFLPVDELDPHVAGANLRVKVVEPFTSESVHLRRDGKSKEVTIRVGDASGTVRMKLEGEQMDLAGLNKVGACITVRNGKIDVLNNRMVLSVSKWGKLLIESEEENADDFNFSVDEGNDKSAVEYELVSMFDDPMVGNRVGGGGGRRGGSGGRGRGGMRRGGFRR